MRFITICTVAALSLMAAGCTSTAMYRSDIKKVCDLSETAAENAPPGCESASIEHDKDFDIAYVELTDQGWFYKRDQLTRALDLLKEYPEVNLDMVVYVHGWKHSARFYDSDVTNFRENIMHTLARPGVHTVGIYVGWRGASLEPRLLQGITYYDRKSTADHVARGSVRELFSHLQAIRNDRTAAPGREVRLTLIGHSFGGLIVYNSVAESLLNSMVAANHGDPASPREAMPIADLVLLLNPAFEASRFEPLFQVAKDQPPRGYADNQRPILVSITSEADLATKIAFPAGRAINSIFEHEGRTDEDPPNSPYAERLEKVANTHTMGHMERYRTHQLELGLSNHQSETSAIECKVLPNPLVADGNRFPLWNMYAMEQVINGHHDIYKPNLWEFVKQISDRNIRLGDICH